MGLKDLAGLFKRRQSSFKTNHLHPLLKSNDPPDELESIEIRERIRALEMDYKKLTGRHWSLQEVTADHAVVKPLNSKASQLDSHIRALRSIFSAFRRLPYEVLQHVMVFAAAYNKPHTVLGLERVEINFGQVKDIARVCRRWKQVVLGTPLLWRHLGTILLDRSKSNLMSAEEDARLKNLQLHLRLSGSLPIVFGYIPSFTRDMDPEALKKRLCEPVLKLLCENAVIWGEVFLHGDLSLYDTLRKEDGGKRFCQMTGLEITLFHPFQGEGAQEVPLTIDAFAEASKLKTVMFKSPSMLYVSRNAPKLILSLPWHQLERYGTYGGGDNSLDKILQVNPKGLLHLEYVVANFYTEPPKDLVTMQRLQVLQLQACKHANRLAALLDCLVLPSLVELQVGGGLGQEDALFTKVQKLILCSGCCLRKLELDDGDDNVDAFTKLIALTPTLEHLDIARPSDAMIAALVLDTSSTDPALPRLTSLTFDIGAKRSIPPWTAEGRRVYECGFQVLQLLLQSRMRTIDPPPGSSHDADYFKTLREVRFCCRQDRSRMRRVWDFQAKLEGPSNVPGLSEEKLREWQTHLMNMFASYLHPKSDFYNTKMQFAMHQYMREVENFNVDAESLRFLCVRADFAPRSCSR